MRLRPVLFILIVVGSCVSAGGQRKAEEVTVHGRVTDLFGYSLEGVNVRFYARTWFKPPTEVKFVKSTTTDAQGNYTADGLPYGYYGVSAELRGFRYAEVTTFFGRGDNLLDIGLEVGALTDVPPIEISGTVRTSGNQVLQDATVVLMSAFNSAILYRARTDRNGKYKFVVYTPSQYLIYAVRPGFEVSASTTLGQAKEKNFFLVPLKNRS
jgi:Carboxypeptidase regulatory-like domain